MIEAAYAHRRIDLMSWTTYRDRLAEDLAIFLPVGALEQHGPHLPMGCDAILAEAMAARVADALDGLLLPALRYGYKSQARSGGGQLFPGTTSLDGATLTSMVRDILREVARHGARRAVIVNGHVENTGTTPHSMFWRACSTARFPVLISNMPHSWKPR
jgi:creatinine amidohydrolase